jgi:CheY-like chemotaxis protein
MLDEVYSDLNMGAGCEKTTFLLVEDDDGDVLLVKRAFSMAGKNCALRSVSDGIEAMRYLSGEGEYADRKRFPLPDLILLDLKLPRFSGFDFLEWLQNQAPGDLAMVPVIVMSGSDQPADVRRAYALGANAYLLKPVSWDVLYERILSIHRFWVEHTETPVICDPKRSS